MLVLAFASLASLLFRSASLVVLSLDAAFVTALAIEIARTPSPKSLRIQRTVPARAGLSSEFARVVTVEPGSAAGLELELREEFPPSFAVVERTVAAAHGVERAPPEAGDPTGGPDLASLDGHAPTRLERIYRGHLRGVHSLGAVRLRVRGPLGLIQRQARLVGRQEIAIEPALPHLAMTLRLAASERWRELGVRVLPRRGGLTEFESLRDYVHGDDVRLVDWKAFAKRSRPTVRQFQIERGQELLLLIDCGRRMNATTEEGSARGWTKLDYALDAALELAAVALQKGDRVGALAFDAGLRAYVPPRRGPRQLARLREGLFDLLPSALESDLARALREASARMRRRALVLVLSDVADPLSIELQRLALSHGSRNHRILFAALDDPALRAEAEPRAGGERRPALRAASLSLIEERRAALRSLSGAGVRVLNALPAEAAGPLLTAWLDERRRGA